MDNQDKIFADGMIVKRNENAPDFVICKLSIKRAEFEKFMAENSKNGWVNLDVKQSRNGKYFAELDTWEPKQSNNNGGDSSYSSADVPF